MKNGKTLLALSTAIAIVFCAIAFADDDDNADGQWITTGQRIAPTAATGAVFQELDPKFSDAPDFRANQAVTTITSHDGKTLLVLTSGFNLVADASGKAKAHSNEFVFVFDISAHTPKQTQTVEVPNTDSGIVFAPDDSHFYVAGGVDDSVHIFSHNNGLWAEDGAAITLGHKAGLGLAMKPSAAGIDVTADGRKIVVANRYNNSVTIADVVTRQVIGELDLRPGIIDPRKHGVPGGTYPDWVAIKANSIAYVTSLRDREVDAIDIPARPN